ncbi:MAG: Inositol 2-dehydrogenase/D-chiro-inositol 3-dehydrogenase [bacterium]|nr:Inositol 2-dehydrogenase/D-chiro-inositol 3-dehydrogenase [bacterium]
MPKKNLVSRRDFIQTAAAGAAAISTWTSAPSIGVAGANDRINIGVIGCGSIATSHGRKLSEIKDEENCAIVACCDIWETRLNEYSQAVKKSFGEEPKKYHDYHELLADPNVDKVLIATPEHWHERMLIDACRAKHFVYCEKPMTHNATEALRVLDVVKETGAIVQVGVQGTEDDSYEAAYEVIKQGMLGEVMQCQIDYVRRYEADAGPWRSGRASDEPKPADLDWDAFLGPAWKRPWDARRYFDWRCYWDYSGGVSTDLFVHRITRIIKACGLKEPIRGIGMGGIFKWDDGREVPDTFEMILEYPGGPTVYCLGTMGNETPIQHLIRGYDATLVFEGPGFNVYSNKDVKEGDVVKVEKGKVMYTHTKTGQESQALHHKNHHAAMRANDPSLLKCPPEIGYYGILAVDLANESYKRKKYMTWNPERKRVVPA